MCFVVVSGIELNLNLKYKARCTVDRIIFTVELSYFSCESFNMYPRRVISNVVTHLVLESLCSRSAI